MHKNLSGPELSEQKFKWTEIKCRQIECVQSALQYIIYYYTIVCLLFSEMDSILNMATKSKWTIQSHACSTPCFLVFQTFNCILL